MQKGLKLISLQGAIEKSPILLSQYWKNEWSDGTIIISFFGGSNNIFADWNSKIKMMDKISNKSFIMQVQVSFTVHILVCLLPRHHHFTFMLCIKKVIYMKSCHPFLINQNHVNLYMIYLCLAWEGNLDRRIELQIYQRFIVWLENEIIYIFSRKMISVHIEATSLMICEYYHKWK